MPRPAGGCPGQTVIGYSFFTHQGSPNAAVAQLVTRWSPLQFVRQHRPLD
jgi:hypothetical protein